MVLVPAAFGQGSFCVFVGGHNVKADSPPQFRRKRESLVKLAGKQALGIALGEAFDFHAGGGDLEAGAVFPDQDVLAVFHGEGV